GRLAQVMLPWNDEDPNWREFRATDAAPWILCVTRNLSLSREMFVRVGWFDGIFQKYGLEDWELGYRLHAHGYKFISMAEVTGVHQEHPAAVRGKEGNEENLRFFFGKHGLRNPEISLFAVHSPEDGLPVYKNALRILQHLRRTTSARHRSAARPSRPLCTLSRSARARPAGTGAGHAAFATLGRRRGVGSPGDPRSRGTSGKKNRRRKGTRPPTAATPPRFRARKKGPKSCAS